MFSCHSEFDKKLCVSYDNLGNPISTIDPNGNQTDTEFDAANRAVKTTFPAVQVGQGSTLQRPVETKSYDKNGNVISSVNPRGIITNTEYNSFNKPVKITKNAGDAEANQIMEELSYDDNGNLEVIRDGNGNKTKYVYDAMNRRTSAIYGYESETTRTDTWAYDALNMTNRKGVTLTYDARNRILTENSRTYAYDPAGRILSVSDSENIKSNVSYSYDALGRILSETNGGRMHNYAYDLSSRRVKSDYGLSPTQLTPTHSLRYKYDTNGRLVSITDQQNRTTSYSYDLNGNIIGKGYPNRSSVENHYDALNRLVNCYVNAKYSFNLYYEYDTCGNLTHMSSNNGIYPLYIDMSYDAFDRLVLNIHYRERSICQYVSYSYDKNSNRLSKTLLQTAGNYSDFLTKYFDYEINSLNQIVSVSEEEIYYDNNMQALPSIYKTKNISYNERGNLTEIEEDGVSTTFNYDEFDMLISTNGGGEYSIHTYDYRGRRVEHGFGNANKEYQTTYTYSDGTNVLETKLDMNNVSEKTTLFYRGSDQGGGFGGINYSEFANGDDLNYKFYNLRGDVIMSLYSNRNKSSTYYFEFGQNEQLSGDITTDRHRANTKVEDETNLLNEGKRFRHLELDIFLTPDPLEYVDGFNPYIYCNQNPWGKWDPEGLAEQVLRTRKLDNLVLGIYYRHSSRVITLTVEEFKNLASNLSDQQKTAFQESFSKTGGYEITVSFFKREETMPDNNKKDILKLEYNNPTDEKEKTEISTKIVPKDKESDKKGTKLASDTLQALKNYEANEQNVEYAPLGVGDNKGNCNSAQNTLNEATNGQFEDAKKIPSGAKNIDKNFSMQHFKESPKKTDKKDEKK